MRAVARQIADTPGTSGTKRIHTTIGEGVNGLAGAIRRGGEVEWIHVRHEDAAAVADLLAHLADREPGLVVTDALIPGMTSLDLVRHLDAKGVKAAVIVISDQAKAMQAGATDVLEQPIPSGALQDGFRDAAQGPASPSSEAAELYNHVLRTLTPRQRDVLAGLLDGLPNKLIAYRLGLSVRTVECYRAAIMDRTRAKSLSELVRISVLAGL